MGAKDAPLSRRGFLGVTLGTALGAAGAYGIIEELTHRPLRTPPGEVEPSLAASFRSSRSAAGSLPPEQYLFDMTETVTDNGVVVSVPPLYHEVVTAKLVTAGTASALQAAQSRLEAVLESLEAQKLLTYTPAGLGLSVGWGLSYFNRLPGSLTQAKLPRDLTAPKVKGGNQYALLPAVAFSTDPIGLILEDNDVVIVMASDSLDHIATAYDAVFKGSTADLFSVTSIRKGFVDATKLAGKSGEQSLTKQFAVKNKLPSANLIPDKAEMFLGFTSTQRTALGPGVITNLESLKGFTDQWPNGYFRYGTTLALSHLYEDLDNWYGANGYSSRVAAAFTPRVAKKTAPGTLTLPEASAQVETESQILSDASYYGTVGHSSSMQPVSRLQAATTDNYGNRYAKDSTIPQRADFNTVDSPFAYSSDPHRDGSTSTPKAGVHFLSYTPTSYYFEQLRRAMDGEYKDGASVGAAAAESAFATSITATHRQNFLVPGRAHRSFPLAELW